MKTTKKLILSLSLLLVPQIAFSAEFGYDTGDELSSSYMQRIGVNTADEEESEEEGEESEENDDSSTSSDESASKSNSFDDSGESALNMRWEAFLNDLGNQETTFGERMKARSKKAKLKIARFYKKHPDAIKRSAIAGGTAAALVGGATVAYTKSSVVKENVDKAASYVAEGTSKAVTAISATYKAAKERIAKATGTTKTIVDGQIARWDEEHFSKADAILLAGAAGLSYGAYKAAPAVKKAAIDLGTLVSSKASEASSSDAATDLKVKIQIAAHYVKEHKAAFAAPALTVAAAYVGYKVYKKVTAKPTAVTEEVVAPNVD